MKYLLLIVMISCTSPLEPEPEPAPLSEFSLSSGSVMAYDVPGGKGLLFTVWVTRHNDGANKAKVTFYVYDINDLIETVVDYPDIPPTHMSTGLAAKSTAMVYKKDELEDLSFEVTVSSEEPNNE